MDLPTVYYGSKLSPNLTKTDEGFLIALNVPIARTGMQKYLPAEVPVDDAERLVGGDGLVAVYREPEEVFSPATIASFEGKPTSDDHPTTTDNKIHPEDVAFYGKGHMQNVRRGTGENADNLVADLIITDPNLIRLVESGDKREVSCGYDCDFVVENDKVYQRNIRGNHVAVVQRGRAGSSVAIKDNEPHTERRKTKMAKETLLKRIQALGIKAFIQDADPEEVAELMGGEKEPEKPAAKDEGDDALAQILEAIKGIDTRLTTLEQSDKEVHSEAMDELDEATKEEEDDPQGDESQTIDSDLEGEEGHHEPVHDSAAVVNLVRQMKPIIAAIPDKATRDSAARVCLDAMRGGSKPAGGTVYGAISKVAQSNKTRAAQDSKPAMTIEERNNAYVAALQKAAAADK